MIKLIIVFLTLVALTIAQPVCMGFQYAPEGAKCDPFIFPEIANNTILCDPFMPCSTLTGLCTKPVSHGTECTHTDNCTSVATILEYECIQNKCTYKRHYGQACSHNDECYSGMCVADKCTAYSIGENCTAQRECRVDPVENVYLYCSTNNTCEAMIAEGEECDLTLLNCMPGLHCVTNGTQIGICKKAAGVNEDCSVAGNEGNPVCQEGLECMFDTKKCEPLESRGENEACQRGNNCGPKLACDIPLGQSTGTCKKEELVNCTSSGGAKCKSTSLRGYCRCTSHDEVGFCASDGKDIHKCAPEYKALVSCAQDKCNVLGRGSPAPFPPDNCAASQCANEFKTFVCCSKEISSVLPDDFLATDCTPPEPSTEPGTSPGDSPSNSSIATGVIVSSAVFVASLLVALM